MSTVGHRGAQGRRDRRTRGGHSHRRDREYGVGPTPGGVATRSIVPVPPTVGSRGDLFIRTTAQERPFPCCGAQFFSTCDQPATVTCWAAGRSAWARMGTPRPPSSGVSRAAGDVRLVFPPRSINPGRYIRHAFLERCDRVTNWPAFAHENNISVITELAHYIL